MFDTLELQRGSYQLKELLSNRVSRTWSALSPAGEKVVLKELPIGQLENWKSYDLFQRELKVLSSLNHPRLPQVHDYFEIEHPTGMLLCLVLSQLPGKPLSIWLKEGNSANETLAKNMAIQILKILDYLHSQNPPILHRDIQPENLLWDGENVYLTDFGAVRDILRPDAGTTLAGVYGFLAPEQYSGRALPCSDLYALGATLVELLGAKPPAERLREDLSYELSDLPISPSFLLWLDHLLDPNPQLRIQNAAEALAELEAPSVQYKPGRFKLPEPPAIQRAEILCQNNCLFLTWKEVPWNFAHLFKQVLFFSLVSLMIGGAGLTVLFSLEPYFNPSMWKTEWNSLKSLFLLLLVAPLMIPFWGPVVLGGLYWLTSPRPKSPQRPPLIGRKMTLFLDPRRFQIRIQLEINLGRQSWALGTEKIISGKNQEIKSIYLKSVLNAQYPSLVIDCHLKSLIGNTWLAKDELEFIQYHLADHLLRYLPPAAAQQFIARSNLERICY